MLSISAEERNIKEKPRTLRGRGLVPSVAYGPKEAPLALSVPKKEFLKLWKEAGESTMLVLEMGDKQKKEVLIHDIALDPVSNEIIHIDFYIPEAGQQVEVSVPLDYIGVSPAVKELGGLLVKVMHDIAVEGLPKDLPHTIPVDIGVLATLDGQILIRDLSLPAGIHVLAGEDEVVAAISVQEEESEEAPSIGLEDIEVEKKGKKEVEAEEGEEKKDS